MTRTQKVLIGAGALGVLLVLFAGWQGARALIAWNRIDRVAFDLEDARMSLPEPLVDLPDVSAPAPTVVAMEYDTVLVIGSDEKPTDLQEGVFADAVMLYMLPSNGSGPLVVSLPRDLIVTNPCTGRATKLDRTLEGCGDEISGEELVALAVEDFTGVGVDHFARFRFDAFVTIIDAMGGVEICTPNPLRQGDNELLGAGCSIADGTTALWWIRNRKLQEFVDGEWKFLDESTGDASRVHRQQALMISMLGTLKSSRSPAELVDIAEQLGGSIALDEALGLKDAVAMVWDLRSLASGSIRTLTIPTEPAVLDDGSFAVRSTTVFAELIGR